MPSGRLTLYTDEIANEIIDRMIDGESLSNICRSDYMPNKGTVYGWVIEDREGFSIRYDRAFNIRAHGMVDEMLKSADDESEEPARSRLKVDTRKWIISKLIPHKYGDRIEEKPDNTEALTEILNKIVNKLPD